MNLAAFRGTALRPISEVAVPPVVVLDAYGGEMGGKSHFACTAAGARGMLYQTFESHTAAGVVSKFADREIVYGSYESEMPPQISYDEPDEVRKYFRAQLERAKSDLDIGLKAGAGVVVVDKGTELWQVVRYAFLGGLKNKDRGGQLNYETPNMEFAEYIRKPAAKGASIIVINEDDDEWTTVLDEKGREKRQTTGRILRKGVNKRNDPLRYLVDASIRLFKSGTPPRFFAELVECRQHPELNGMQLESPDFATVASLIKPEVDPSVWL